jgi:alkylation response protein AidB-like acyl-CoA dehydrogenase
VDFDDTPQEATFRAEVKQWLTEAAPLHAPPAHIADAEGFEQMPLARRWQAAKADARFAQMTWPEEFGGRGAPAIFDVIFAEEQRRYSLPPDPFGISLGMCIPTMMRWADRATHERHVRPALRGETLWCQLFSEPSAGSDLGNVRTRAVKDGEDWLITGQKVWTTGAHHADWGTILVRTDPTVEKYAGLSYFYFNMRSPGVEVRRIRQISGAAAFNEVFLTEVRVPDSQRLGKVGEGWRVAISTLMLERLSVNEADITNVTIDDVISFARDVRQNGSRAIDDPMVRAQLAQLYARIVGVRYTRYRTLTQLSRGEMPGPEAAMGKAVLGSAIQEMAKLAMSFHGVGGIVADREGLLGLADMQEAWFYAAGLRIAGGTDEILKNIIAERVLELPQDARVDRGVPFNKLNV